MRPFDTWARRIESPAKAPKIFRGSLPENHSQVFPYTVYAPVDRWGLRKSHPKLLYTADGRLSLLELGKAGVVGRALPFADVTHVEVGRILLHAWLKVSGCVEGQPTSITVEYNSVVEDLFRPFTETIRAMSAGILPAGSEALRLERGKFDSLAVTSYKYANLAKTSLLPGERVLATVFEPAIGQRRLLGLFPAVPTHLMILTDRELILIRDDRHRDGRESYGGIWTYVPLCKIKELILESEAGGGVSLVVRLTGGDCLRSRFSATNREELRRLEKAFIERGIAG